MKLTSTGLNGAQFNIEQQAVTVFTTITITSACSTNIAAEILIVSVNLCSAV